MSQDTKPAPFNLGDHVRYVAAQKRAASDNQGNEMNLVLAPGMVGVVVLSTGAFSAEGAGGLLNSWRCVRFSLRTASSLTSARKIARTSKGPTVQPHPQFERPSLSFYSREPKYG